MTPRFDRCRDWWRRREPRERHLLLAGAAVCALALGHAGLAGLAQLRAQALAQCEQERRVLGRMQRRADELAHLKARPPVDTPQGGRLREAAALLLQRYGLPAPLLQNQADDDTLQLEGQAPFDGALNWLAAAQRELGLAVRSARIEAGDSPGMVKLQLTLASREAR
jgi:type II secretory pathway component PulM